MPEKKPTIRRTKQSDLIDAITLVMTTTNDLRRRRGMSVTKVTKLKEPPPLLVHMLKSDPEGSFVAVGAKGKVVGFTMAVIREDEWYLAFLFVDPLQQSHGLGQKLLDKAMKYGRSNNCRRWALATFAVNPQAVAVYSKLGMPPQRPLLSMDRKRNAAASFKKLRVPVKLSMKIVTDEIYVNRLTELDRRARQLARPEEHLFWLNEPTYSTLAFFDGRKLVGYAVVSSRGMIAPAVAAKPEYLSSILAEAVNWSMAQNATFQIVFVQGCQAEIIKMLMAAGFHIDEVTLMMASEPISDPTLYVPATLAHF